MINKQTKTKLSDKFQKSAKCKDSHSSSMSNITGWGLNNEGHLLKVHYMCPNLKRKCQQRNSFAPFQC